MKSFLLSLSALILLCLVVFLNTLFVSKVSYDMQEMVNKIKSSPTEESIKELEDTWNSKRTLISISVPHKETDDLDKNILILRSKFENGEDNGMNEIISLISYAIDELKVHGTISFDNIF